jgi:mRNA interferase HicA
MKRKDLLRIIESKGCYLLRHGARHDVFVNPANGRKQPVPRHVEVDENLAKHIQKFLGL